MAQENHGSITVHNDNRARLQHIIDEETAKQQGKTKRAKPVSFDYVIDILLTEHEGRAV